MIRFRSLKTKLIVGMASLLIVSFGVTAFWLIQQKTRELSEDISRSVRTFADLTAPQVVDLYELYLAEESFVYFNREIQTLFSKTQEVTGIGLAHYSGVVLYDSTQEQARQYVGEERVIEDVELLDRIQATYPSVKLTDGRLVFFRATPDEELEFLDLLERPVEPIQSTDRLVDVIYPQGNRYAVLYAPSYEVLDARIAAMWRYITVMAILAILLGMGFAYGFSVSITRPLSELREGAEELGQGDFSSRVQVQTKDEVGILAQTFNTMAEDLEKSMDARAYQERLGKELELAAGIQKQIIPEIIPKVPGLDLAAGIIPAAEVGGDVYDFVQLDEDNYFGYVGDVTGHGVPAALVVSIANALIDSFSMLKDPHKILVEANTLLKKKTTANMFITLVLWHWNPKTGKFVFVNAGHEVPLHYSATPVKTEEIKTKGIALGMVPDIAALVEPREVDLKSGDCLILYTDGIPEAWRNEKEQYGMPEFKRVITQTCDLQTAEAIKTSLLADVKQWSQGYEQKDDITVMVIKKL